MPLYILAPLVVIGVTAVVWIVHMAGGSARPAPLTMASASRELGLDYPDFPISDGVVSADDSTALLMNKNTSEIALVHHFGGHMITRIIGENSLLSSEINGDELKLNLRDFTLPALSIQLHNDNEIQQVAARLDALQKDHS